MTKICIEDNCKTQCFFGPSNGNPIFCSKHKKEGMVDNASKKCLTSDCKKSPSFNFANQKPIYCAIHKLEKMVRTSHKNCKNEDCLKSPSYNLNGKPPLYCSEHKTENMIDVKHKSCDNEACRRIKLYGYPRDQAKYCKKHKLEGMIDLLHKLCESNECETRPTFGIVDKKPTHCASHKSEEMKNVVDKHCTSCGLFKVYRKNNWLCFYCQPFPRLLKKEHKVKALLEEKGLVFTHNKQINNDCCLKYKPDFLFDCGSYFVVLECDENGHADYDRDCEMVRMNNISIGLGLPTLFIRYNPDLPGFKVKQKHRILIETLNKYLNLEMLEDPTPIYLFYKE